MVKEKNRKHYRTLRKCKEGYDGIFKVINELLENKSFIKAARSSTTPSGFKRHSNKLINISNMYDAYRISLSASNGRTYFDSALPKTNHDGTYVKDINGNNINISGSPDVLYANMSAYDLIYQRRKRNKEKDLGGDVRWDETIGAIQYFLTITVLNNTNHQCDKQKFILRVSNKPELLLKPGIIPIEAQNFIVIDNQPFIIVDNNIFPIKQKNITKVNNKRFTVINGQPIMLP